MFGWGKKESEKQSYGIPTVRFDPAKVTETVKADLRRTSNRLLRLDPAILKQSMMPLFAQSQPDGHYRFFIRHC
jgi:hypothetical protein